MWIGHHNTFETYSLIRCIIQRVVNPGVNTPKEDENGKYVNEYSYDYILADRSSGYERRIHQHMSNKTIEKLREIPNHTVVCSDITELFTKESMNPLMNLTEKTICCSIGHFCYDDELRYICKWVKEITKKNRPKTAIVSWYHPHRKLYMILVLTCLKYEKHKRFILSTTVGMYHS